MVQELSVAVLLNELIYQVLVLVLYNHGPHQHPRHGLHLHQCHGLYPHQRRHQRRLLVQLEACGNLTVGLTPQGVSQTPCFLALGFPLPQYIGSLLKMNLW